MANRLQEILSKAEITPPPTAWEKIQSALDTEFDAKETRLAEKLFLFETEPPSLIWQNIEADLANNPLEEKKPARVIAMPVRRMAVAAGLIGIVSVSALYLFRATPGNITDNVQAARVTTAIEDVSKHQISPANTISIPSGSLLAASHLIKATPHSKRNIRKDVEESDLQNSDEPTATADHADPNELAAAKIPSTIDVSAPPIRDGSGNVILDPAVISSPDKEYITVTAPNGEQTRLSSKFLSLMRVPNGSSFSHNDQWKKILEEWRTKLLQDGAFIPALNNYLDIFELKEIVQDK
jgi:hypothetical protein